MRFVQWFATTNFFFILILRFATIRHTTNPNICFFCWILKKKRENLMVSVGSKKPTNGSWNDAFLQKKMCFFLCLFFFVHAHSSKKNLEFAHCNCERVVIFLGEWHHWSCAHRELLSTFPKQTCHFIFGHIAGREFSWHQKTINKPCAYCFHCFFFFFSQTCVWKNQQKINRLLFFFGGWGLQTNYP